MESADRKKFKDLMEEAGFSAPAYARRYKKSERTVRRWMAEDSADEEARELLKVRMLLGTPERRTRRKG